MADQNQNVDTSDDELIFDDEIVDEPIDQKFNVEWVNRDDTFAHVISQMYTNKKQFDLVIKLDNGEQLVAHRHVMVILSPKIKEMLEKELEADGSFAKAESEVELSNIPGKIMKKILDFIYKGSVHVCKSEIKKFCDVSTQLGISTFYEHEIKKYKKLLNAPNETLEMVYRGRGRLLADGFKQMFIDSRWFDIKIEADGTPFAAHRIALSAGSEFFEDTLGALPPTTVKTTVTPAVGEVSLSFAKTYDMVAFICCGVLQTNCMVETLNHGKSFGIPSLDYEITDLHAEVPEPGQPSNERKIFVKAEDIPTDHALRMRKLDIIRQLAAKESQKNTKRMSSSSASGSEYDVKKDSENYSDSDDEMPLVTEVKHTKRQRAANVSKKVSPQKSSIGQKRNKGNASARKPANGNSRFKTPSHSKESVPKIVSNKSQGEATEETVTMSKSEYELLMRLLQQRNGESEAVPPESEQQIDGEPAENEYDQQYQYENDEILDQAAENYQQQHGDDSNYQDFDNDDQYPYENDDGDEILEGAVGGSGQKYDENDNSMENGDESKAENGSGENYLEDNDENTNSDIDSKQGGAVPANGFHVRTWTDEDFVDEAEFDTSPRGATRLLHDGYRYTLNNYHRNAKDYKRWQCANFMSKWKCKAKTKTKEFDGIEFVQKPNPGHTHPRDF